MRYTQQIAAPCALALLATTTSQASLVAHWTGDNTAADATVNGYDGTLTGTAAYAPGLSGGAFSFDGTNGSAVVVNADLALEPTSFSISLWVRAEMENHIRLLADSTHGAGSAGWALQLDAANNVTFAYGNGIGFPEATAAIGIEDGQFHHVAATLDGDNIRLYVDGVLEQTLAYTGLALPSGRNIQLGDHASFDRPLQGALDEVRLYDHVLDQAEITQLASIPSPGAASLIGLSGAAMLRSRRKR